MSDFTALSREYEEALSIRDKLSSEFDEAQSRVLALGSRIQTEVSRTERRSHKAVSAPRPNGAHAPEIRAWAKQNKMKCPDKGRIPNAVVEAFYASHRS